MIPMSPAKVVTHAPVKQHKRRSQQEVVQDVIASASGFRRFQLATCQRCGAVLTDISAADAHSVLCGCSPLHRTVLNLQKTGWV